MLTFYFARSLTLPPPSQSVYCVPACLPSRTLMVASRSKAFHQEPISSCMACPMRYSAQTWGGRSVRYRSPVAVDPFGGNQGASFPKGTEIDVAGDGIYVNTGSFTSNEFGLSIEYRQHEPLGISVTAGQTAQVTVDVSGH